jgi:serine/threonine protein phosphatase PrpC
MTNATPGQHLPVDPDDTATTLIAPRPPFSWVAFGLTDTGKVRQINEDAFFIHPNQPLWVVADGMGGHSAGDVASSSIAKAFDVAQVPSRLSAFADFADSTLIDLNFHFRELADFGRHGATIGSTVVVLTVSEGYALFLWVGDSRIYRSRGGILERITEDHSQVEELIASGAIKREDAEARHGANIVTRAVGAADEVCVDMDYCILADGDRFLLCSDGLTKVVPESAIGRGLGGPGSAEAIARDLMAQALATRAPDNITLIVATISAARGVG